MVDSAKLLESNPWKQFTWIDGTSPHKRRFTSEELVSLLDYFEINLPGVVAATLFAMHGNYVDDTDEELLLKSNRTFERIVTSLPLRVAERYGYDPEEEGAGLPELLKGAIDRQDWHAVEELMAKIRNGGGQ